MNPLTRAGSLFIGFSRRESTLLIVAAVAIGLLAGTAYWLFALLIETISRIAIGADTSGAVAAFSRLPLPVRFLVPLVGVFVAGFIIRYLSPESAGAGIALLLKAIRRHNGVLPYLLAPCKMVTAALTIACGAPLGLEGPVIVIGAGIGSSGGRLLRSGFSRMKLLLGCGAAAGLAVAFNAPIAGTIFAVETVMGSYTIGTLTPVVVAAVTASFFGAWVMPGHQSLPLAHIAERFGAAAVSARPLGSGGDIVLYLALALLLSLLGVFLVRATRFLAARFDPLKKKLPAYLHTPLLLLPFVLVVPFVPVIFGLGKDVMTDAFSWAPWLLVGVALLKLALLPFAFSSGASGGIFFPLIFVGFIFGLGSGKLAALAMPEASAGMPYGFAVVGCGALLGAATQEPITTFLLVFELTRDYAILPALMLGTVTSVLVSKLLSPVSLYNYQLAIEGIETEATEETSLMQETRVEACYQKDCVTALPHESLIAVVDRMREKERFEAYVVDETGRYLGAINAVLTSAREVQYGLISPLVVARDLVNPDFPIVRLGDSLASAMRRMAEYDVIELPVVGEDGKLLGCIHEHDIIAFYEREVLAKAHLVKMVGPRAERDDAKVRLSDEFVIETVPVSADLAGKNIVQLDLRRRYGIQVLAVREKGRDRGTVDPERLLEEGDTLVIAGRRDRVAAFRQSLGNLI